MSGLTLTLTVTSYTFTVAAGGTTATESARGTAVTTGAAALSCTVTASATYKKAPWSGDEIAGQSESLILDGLRDQIGDLDGAGGFEVGVVLAEERADRA